MAHPSPIDNNVGLNIRPGQFHADSSGPELNIIFYTRENLFISFSRIKPKRLKGRARRIYRQNSCKPFVLVRQNQVRDYFFVRDGEGFRLGIPGGKVVTLGDLKGAKYLFQAISNAGQEICVSELMPKNGYDQIRAILSLSRDEIIDEEGLKNYDASLADYDRRIEHAQSENDEEKVECLKKERAVVLSRRNAAIDIHRRRRVMNDPLEKMRKAVCNAISRVLKKIRKQDEVLWKHLVRFLKRGRNLFYGGQAGVVWYTGTPI